MLVHSLLVESIYLRRLGGSAGGNDVLSDRFDRCLEAPGEKKPGPLRRERARDSAADRASSSVDHLNYVVSPVVFTRPSSILVVVLMDGHTSSYPWAPTHDLQEIPRVDSMKSLQFEFFVERSSYWRLYFGWSLLNTVLLLTLATILW